MKKVIFALLALFTFTAFTSCSDDENYADPAYEDVSNVPVGTYVGTLYTSDASAPLVSEEGSITITVVKSETVQGADVLSISSVAYSITNSSTMKTYTLEIKDVLLNAVKANSSINLTNSKNSLVWATVTGDEINCTLKLAATGKNVASGKMYSIVAKKVAE